MKKILRFTGRLLFVLFCLAFTLLISGFAGCSSPPKNNAQDEAITARVRTALNEDPLYKYDRVVVVTDKGVVQLSGFTSTSKQKDQAEAIAEKVPGVRDVENKITVKN